MKGASRAHFFGKLGREGKAIVGEDGRSGETLHFPQLGMAALQHILKLYKGNLMRGVEHTEGERKHWGETGSQARERAERPDVEHWWWDGLSNIRIDYVL